MWALTPKISGMTTMAPRGLPAGSARYAENLWPSAAASSIILPMLSVSSWIESHYEEEERGIVSTCERGVAPRGRKRPDGAYDGRAPGAGRGARAADARHVARAVLLRHAEERPRRRRRAAQARRRQGRRLPDRQRRRPTLRIHRLGDRRSHPARTQERHRLRRHPQ